MAENCALNPDGSLKDASEMAWDYSPSHNYPPLPETCTDGGSSAALSVAPPKHSIPSLKRKRGEPESHQKAKGNGHGAARIKSLNLGMSGMCKVECWQSTAHQDSSNCRNNTCWITWGLWDFPEWGHGIRGKEGQV